MATAKSAFTIRWRGMPIALATTEIELNAALAGRRPMFVPTMGALHAGHAALMRQAVMQRDTLIGNPRRPPVVASIFVNPTQFAPGEDFTRYPRQLERDQAICAEAGADVIFAPEVNAMYPAGLDRVAENFIMPGLPAVATQPRLEDRFRPTHFAGVCKVVARLFDIVQPSHAYFGEKDYQQLRTITEMVRGQNHLAPGHDRGHAGSRPAPSPERWPNLEIIPCPTVRERDGLAMSSRNVYLTPPQRKTALILWRALSEAKQEKSPAAAEDVMRVLLEEADFQIDYAVVRDAQTLLPVERFDRPCRGLIAAKIGGGGATRLIDNMAMPVR